MKLYGYFLISAKKRVYLFCNALDHNDSSALPGHFMRTIINYKITINHNITYTILFVPGLSLSIKDSSSRSTSD